MDPNANMSQTPTGNVIINHGADDHPLIHENEKVPPTIVQQPEYPYPPQPIPMPAPQPMYNVLPDGQVQVVYNMPPGFVPPPPAYYPTAPPTMVKYGPVAPPTTYYNNPQNTDADGLWTAALITYVVGLFVFLPSLASYIITFKMTKKGYVHPSKVRVVNALAIAELIFWVLCLGLCWLVVKDSDCSSSYYYDGEYEYLDCYDWEWWGWVFIVAWWLVAISCGIPRVVYLKRRPQ